MTTPTPEYDPMRTPLTRKLAIQCAKLQMEELDGTIRVKSGAGWRVLEKGEHPGSILYYHAAVYMHVPRAKAKEIAESPLFIPKKWRDYLPLK